MLAGELLNGSRALTVIRQPNRIVHQKQGLVVPSVMVPPLMSDQGDNPVGSHEDVAPIFREGNVDILVKVKGSCVLRPSALNQLNVQAGEPGHPAPHREIGPLLHPPN